MNQKNNFWTLLDELFTALRSKQISYDTKNILMATVFNWLKKPLSEIKENDEERAIIFQSFTYWLTINGVELLADPLFSLCHEDFYTQIISIYQLFSSLDYCDFLEIIEFFSTIIHENSKIYDESLPSKIITFVPSDKFYIPSYIPKRNINININREYDICKIYDFFFVAIQCNLDHSFTFVHSHVTKLIETVTKAVHCCEDEALVVKGIEINCQLFIKLPKKDDSLKAHKHIYHCLKLINKIVDLKESTISSLASALNHTILIDLFPMCEDPIALFSSVLEVICCLLNDPKYHDSAVTIWIPICFGLIPPISFALDSQYEVFIFVDMLYSHQEIFSVVQEWIRRTMIKSVPQQANTVNQTQEFQETVLIGYDVDPILHHILNRIKQIISRKKALKSFISDHNFNFVINALNMVYTLKKDFQLNHNISIVFFDDELLEAINKFILSSYQIFVSGNDELFPYLVKLSNILLKVIGKTFKNMIEVRNIFSILFYVQNEIEFLDSSGLELIVNCIEGLCFVAMMQENTDSKEMVDQLLSYLIKIIKNDVEGPITEKCLPYLIYLFLSYDYTKRRIIHIFETIASTKLSVIVTHPIIGKYITCLISNRLFLNKQVPDAQYLQCHDCDLHSSNLTLPPVRRLMEHSSIVVRQYGDSLLEYENKSNDLLWTYIVRYDKHSNFFKDFTVLHYIMSRFLQRKFHDGVLHFRSMWEIVSNADHSINMDMIKILIQCLIDVYQSASSKVLHNICIMIQSIPFKEMIIRLVKILIIFFIGPDMDTRTLRKIIIPLLDRFDLNLNTMLMENEEEFGKFFAGLIIYNLGTKKILVHETIGQLSKLFGFTRQSFTSCTTRHILPHIMSLCDPENISYVFQELADILNLTVQQLVTKYFEDVFSYIYFDKDKVRKKAKLELLLRLAESNLRALFYYKFKKVVLRIILDSDMPLSTVNFLYEISRDETKFNSETSYLQQTTVGLLSAIDIRLSCTNSSKLSIQKCIKAIGGFIEILGTNVTSIRIKLLDTLTGAGQHLNQFPNLCLKNWTLFCYSVNLQKIAPYLSTIVLQLIPLYSYYPYDVSCLLHYLVVENGALCLEYIPDLYFIPHIPNDDIMLTVWKTVNSVISTENDYQNQIRRIIKHMNYDNLEARASALRQLHLVLKKYVPKFHDKALKSETLDPLFEEILSCIMSNVNYKNAEIKVACAMCIGELGALDPARFTFKIEKVKYQDDIYDIKSKQFASVCIGVMVQELKNCNKMEVVYIIVSSMQELLKMYFKKGDKDTLFANFTVDAQDILEPLFRTRYIFKRPTLKLRPHHDIVFGSHVSYTPTKWAYDWCSEILTFVPNSFQREVFIKCLPCFPINLQIVETILPYIVLHVILFCDSLYVNLIEKEIKCILNWDIERERTPLPGSMTLRRKHKAGDITSMYSEEKHTKYLAIVLDLIEFLHKAYINIEVHSAQLGVEKEKLNISNLKDLLNRFSATGLSLKSYMYKDFYRSLYYIENSFADSDYTDINFFSLRNTYAKLNDLDGLLGVMRCGNRIPKMEERMLKHVVSGTVQDAVGGYETIGMKYKSTNSYRVLIQCYLCINQPYVALRLSKDLINERFYMDPSLYNDHIEALWSTSSYDELNTTLNRLGPRISNNWCWGTDLIGAFQNIRDLSIDKIVTKVNSMQCLLIDKLSEINKISIFKYRQGYEYVVKLHILNELSSFAKLLYKSCMDGDFNAVHFNQYFHQLDCRLKLLPSHGNFIQDVFKVRQQCVIVAIELCKRFDYPKNEIFVSELGKMWIQTVKMERKNGSLTNAYSNIGIAESFAQPDLFIQKAKYYRANNETDSAVFVLKQGIRELSNNKNSDSNDDDLRLSAKAKMLISKYNVENMNVDFIKGYESIYEAVSLYNLEESFVYLGQYLYKQHLSERAPDKSPEKREIQYKAAMNFSKSLLFGCKFIYQSMPCLLTLWLDFSARAVKDLSVLREKDHGSLIKSYNEILNKFNSLMENSVVCLPTYMFMTAFTQILSRINHPSVACFAILKKIILHIFQEYPHQAMWFLVSTFKGTHELQRKRVSEIIQHVQRDSEKARFVHGFIEFVDNLIDLSNKKSVSYTPKLKLQILSPNLRKTLKMRNVVIMIPSQRLRNIDIPNYKYCKSVMERMQHDPFPHTKVFFKDVEEDVDVFLSVQKPKKITFIGSDGKQYPILCKNMDDLRLDSRIMEFNSIINLYLRRDSAAHDRGLLIRTYSVVPLNHECGLIEWLPNVTPFKHVITHMYKQLKIQQMTSVEIKSVMTQPGEPIEKKLKVFQDILLPRHPPVLHKWFFQAFPRPDAWYLARRNFVRTLAVMSLVGYTVGLGDRHGENILIDTTTGEIVHVDFNCLFNKGEILPYPETVPFRLTQNIVKAMGPTGMEGVFLKSCEITNAVLRSNADQLISVIKPFLYDIDRAPKSVARNGIDFINEEAKLNILNVQKRLSGVVRTKGGLKVPVMHSNPLSVDGQIRALVDEATSPINLCQLYFGWAPFL